MQVQSELMSCVNKGGGPGLIPSPVSAPVPNKPHGFCGRKAPRRKEEYRCKEHSHLSASDLDCNEMHISAALKLVGSGEGVYWVGPSRK